MQVIDTASCILAQTCPTLDCLFFREGYHIVTTHKFPGFVPLRRVCKSLGMVRPTQVQRGCIPAILGGRDVLGTAHTGSGKTAAFALPILQRLAREPYGIFALVLTPTR